MLPVQNCDKKYLRQQKDVAHDIVQCISIEDKNELKLWCEELLSIRKSSLSKAQKIKKSFKVTAKASNIFSVLKIISVSIKKYAWDDRKVKGKLGLLGVGLGVSFFAGQAAGIAALGSAVGVPLWVVFGAGGTFAGFIIEEVERVTKSTNIVIDAKFEEIKE